MYLTYIRRWCHLNVIVNQNEMSRVVTTSVFKSIFYQQIWEVYHYACSVRSSKEFSWGCKFADGNRFAIKIVLEIRWRIADAEPSSNSNTNNTRRWEWNMHRRHRDTPKTGVVSSSSVVKPLPDNPALGLQHGQLNTPRETEGLITHPHHVA